MLMKEYMESRALADYDFSKAETIVSIGADILGDWQGGGYDSGYAKSRVPKKSMVDLKCHIIFSLSLI